MPLYTVTTQIGVLSTAAKAKFAAEVTTFHSEYSGTPKNWIHIVFQDYPQGSGFTAGRSSATATLTLLIRPAGQRNTSVFCYRGFGTCSNRQPVQPMTRSPLAFMKYPPVRQWRWGTSCRR